MTGLKNEFSWSLSRDRLFNNCKRAYYYYYYASWNGWDKFASVLARKAYLLKKIQTLDMWGGDIAHQVIRWILQRKKTGQNVSYKEASDKASSLLNKGWHQSKDKKWKENIKHNLNLFEHYYDKKITQEMIDKKVKNKVYKSLKNLYRSDFFDNLRSIDKEDYIFIDDLDHFVHQNMKIFAVPDFAVKDDFYWLYDWKTGRRSERDKLQLSCYALYAFSKLGISIDKVKIIPAYLTEEKVSLNPIQIINIDEVKNYINKSILRMKSVLEDFDKNQIDLKKCPKTENTKTCKYCNFQEICFTNNQ